MAAPQIRNDEETLKLTPTFISIVLKYLSITINSVNAERSFSSYMEVLCHPNNETDPNSKQTPSILIKVHSEFEK